ncbi:hypothetical protein AB0C34_09590 [Nocardia sp. NPDC049220]|uniref:hypothetical protein n=1 Tax=Nocardia sp. NPDC049220 TaxID=3155273 RepID=UPI0033DCAE6D
MSRVAQRVAELLDRRCVHDVLVPGWIDRDDVPSEFRPQPLALWLRLDLGMVRLAARAGGDHLSVRHDTIPSWSDIELLAQAESEVVLASYGEQLFGDGRDALACVAVRGYETTTGKTSALGIDFDGGHTLFLDPSWTFGIRMGSRAGEIDWVEKYGRDRSPRFLRLATTRDG